MDGTAQHVSTNRKDTFVLKNLMSNYLYSEILSKRGCDKVKLCFMLGDWICVVDGYLITS